MEEKLHRPECMPFGMYKYKPFEEIVKITEVKNGKKFKEENNIWNGCIHRIFAKRV